jgi:hypothetical protein
MLFDTAQPLQGAYVAITAGESMLANGQRGRHSRTLIFIFIAALSACFAGCASTTSGRLTNAAPVRPRAETRLAPQVGASLRAQAGPDCKLQAVALGDTWLDTQDALLRKSDYERQCYQQAQTAARGNKHDSSGLNAATP